MSSKYNELSVPGNLVPLTESVSAGRPQRKILCTDVNDLERVLPKLPSPSNGVIGRAGGQCLPGGLPVGQCWGRGVWDWVE